MNILILYAVLVSSFWPSVSAIRSHRNEFRYNHNNKYTLPSSNQRRLQGGDRLTCLQNAEIWIESGGCDFKSFLEALGDMLEEIQCSHGPMEELMRLTNRRSGDKVEKIFFDACEDAYEEIHENFIDFEEITGQSSVFIKAFFDGGTDLNDLRQTKDRLGQDINILQQTPGADVRRLLRTVAKIHGISWPDNISNFDNCELRSVMCCWVQDRQARDGNGNCRMPYDRNCVDADPDDNTDVCYVDLGLSPQSNHVESGFAVFGDGVEGNAHCHGFAWSNDMDDLNARFKGNLIFYIALYDHLVQRGYVKNVPGAPMCGCIEQMPRVTRSDCTQIDPDRDFAQYVGIFFGLGQGLDIVIDEHSALEFSECVGIDDNNNDLSAYYESLVIDGRASRSEKDEVDNILVGENNCGRAIDDM